MPDIEQRLAEIERRLAEVEKNSHPPIDLEPFIRRAVAAALRRRKC